MRKLHQNSDFFIFFTLLTSTTTAIESVAQQCSAPLEAMTAKYWQYRENFNQHFILLDRDSTGCVGDGIGQQSGDSCEFSKAGYSLPATSIVQVPDGAWGMRDRNPEPNEDQTFKNGTCADAGPSPGTHWQHDSILPKTHNYLEMGSETPHQMGWYWATLATEYELLRLNGQHEEAQRTLEELFLGLQAYRRLDMQAQCLARKRYNEIRDNFEVEQCDPYTNPLLDCLCGEKYWMPDFEHSNFGVPCINGCDWQPDLSGYSGFYLREDATQGLEVLHDPSEDRYNIDLVSSDYAMSLSPPCDSNFSQPCYLAHRQNYMSQDGVTGLLIGLALIKRYIPENAEVTTCDGTKYKPLEMAKKITSAMVDRIDDTRKNRIIFPGSDECCLQKVELSNFEGGQAGAIIHGLKKAADYIDGRNRHSSFGELFNWSGLRKLTEVTTNSNAKFWLRLKAIGWDMGEERNATKTLFKSAANTQNVEILSLINNLLHPGGDNLDTDQAYFEEMLCKAPCGGPCFKQAGYGGDHPEDWPEYDCPNEPEWIGQRWEGGAGPGENRLFSGLDYMVLHNIYRLHYNLPNHFYNPERPDDYSKLGSSYIDGPDVLCPVNTGHYEIISSYVSSIISNITWETSSNLEVLEADQNTADIRANSALDPSFIQALFEESRPLYQRFFEEASSGMPGGWFWNGDTVYDKCQFIYRKPIITTTEEYLYDSRVDHCLKEYEFRAVGLTTPGVEFHWKIELLGTSIVYNYTGEYMFLSGSNIFPVTNGALRVTLTVTAGDCSQSNEPYIEALNCFGGGMGLRIAPNPAQDQVAVEVIPSEGTGTYTITDPNGIRIRITPHSGGTAVADVRLYSNGESVNISNLQEGLYIVEANEADLAAPLTATLVIAR
ncbi:MAG: T9SS C-terminal target domain-containing protein [Haliscomenobacteraceae bacterium CHB4]|nr:T9SS C-terminal target domain-containing protein [Haliscomenobacteraceae bacterium CHB4]